MDVSKPKILDISIDTSDPEKSTLEVLKHVKPEWNEDGIIIEVRNTLLYIDPSKLAKVTPLLLFFTLYFRALHCFRGRGNSTVVRVSVYQAGDPSSRPPSSACVRKVEFYHCAIDPLPPVPTTWLKKGGQCVIMSM